MPLRELKRDKARELMKTWKENQKVPTLSGEDKKMREFLQKAAQKVEEENKSNSSYYIDVHFGMALYSYLSQQSWFSLRTAENDDFWRYLSLKIVPDLVAKRWGYDQDSRYWKTPKRIWLSAIWWYIYLSWQGSEQETLQLLDLKRFSTDNILNLVERPGRKGSYIEVMRLIMKYYGEIPEDILKATITKIQQYNKKETLFRGIMKLNTAKTIVLIPEFVKDGVEGYVKGLFFDMGIEL